MITVVGRPRVPGGNTVELTLEKIRAGILPVPADNVLDRIIEYARYHGVDAEWTRRDGYPVVLMRYTPNLEREDVQLEELQIRARPDPARRPVGSGQRSLPSTDLAVAQGASVEVSHAEDPRSRPPRIRAGCAQFDLADQLRARQLHAHPIRSTTRASDRALCRPSGRARDFPKSRPHNPGRSADGPAAPGPVGPRPATIGDSIAQVRKTSPCSSIRSQWTPFQTCSSKTKRGIPGFLGR